MSDNQFYESLDETKPGHTFLDSNELVLNMGPQHPSTHGVLRVILKLDGEKVNGIECVIGYLHRGIEKIAENRTWAGFGPFVDRLDYTAAVSNSLGYCLAVEKLLGVEVPKRAQYLRVIHAFRIGGCRWDAYDGFAKEVLKVCDDLGPMIDEYRDLITGNRIWMQRTKDVGYISVEDCMSFSITGPVLRGSGVAWDLRKAQPYSSYEDFDFDIPIGTAGDTFDRYVVRVEEMRQSIRIIRQAMEGLPEGPIIAKVPKVLRPPAGEVYMSIEAPKGELGYFMVSDGGPQPYRVRVRPPSFINLQALEKMAVGSLVADVVAIIGTLDIVLGEVDR